MHVHICTCLCLYMCVWQLCLHTNVQYTQHVCKYLFKMNIYKYINYIWAHMSVCICIVLYKGLVLGDTTTYMYTICILQLHIQSESSQPGEILRLHLSSNHSRSMGKEPSAEPSTLMHPPFFHREIWEPRSQCHIAGCQPRLHHWTTDATMGVQSFYKKNICNDMIIAFAHAAGPADVEAPVHNHKSNPAWR